MSITDFLFIAFALCTIGIFFTSVGAILFRRWNFARRSLGCLAVFWSVYLAAGTAIAVMSRQRIRPIGEDRCFDEMCFAVTGFRCVPSIGEGPGAVHARGIFYIVDVRLSNRSRGRTQHEAGRIGLIVDAFGRNYKASVPGTQALRNAKGFSSALDTDLNPGEAALAKLVFDLPSDVTQPGFAFENSLVFYPPRIISGDEMHFLHKPTITPLE